MAAAVAWSPRACAACTRCCIACRRARRSGVICDSMLCAVRSPRARSASMRGCQRSSTSLWQTSSASCLACHAARSRSNAARRASNVRSASRAATTLAW
jgi:hypothetical protein